MKKNLQLALALMLGFATTVSAQDWSVDSRSRINMSGDNDRFETEQRFRVGTSFGGDDWGVHISSNVNTNLGVDEVVSATLHEAFATANVAGYDVSVGRQALEFGNGSIIGANDWAPTANTRDGLTTSMEFSGTDVTVFAGSRVNDGAEDASDYAGGSYFGANATGDMSGFGYNLLYVTQSGTLGTDFGGTGEETELTAMGLDISYATMGANLTFSYNTVDDGSDMDYNYYSAGVEYPVSDQLTVEAKMTQYSDDGFALAGSNTGFNGDGANSWFTHGNMGFLEGGDQMMSFGGSYVMGDFSVGVSMHQVSNEDFVNTDGSEYERNVTMLDLGYKLGNNSSFTLMYATDDNRLNNEVEETFMFATLKVGL